LPVMPSRSRTRRAHSSARPFARTLHRNAAGTSITRSANGNLTLEPSSTTTQTSRGSLPGREWRISATSFAAGPVPRVVIWQISLGGLELSTPRRLTQFAPIPKHIAAAAARGTAHAPSTSTFTIGGTLVGPTGQRRASGLSHSSGGPPGSLNAAAAQTSGLRQACAAGNTLLICRDISQASLDIKCECR
jgi:hypothetical protein